MLDNRSERNGKGSKDEQVAVENFHQTPDDDEDLEEEELSFQEYQRLRLPDPQRVPLSDEYRQGSSSNEGRWAVGNDGDTASATDNEDNSIRIGVGILQNGMRTSTRRMLATDTSSSPDSSRMLFQAHPSRGRGEDVLVRTFALN